MKDRIDSAGAESMETALDRIGAEWRRGSAPQAADFAQAVVARARVEKVEPSAARILPMPSRRAWLGLSAAAAAVLVVAGGALVLRETAVGSVTEQSGRVSVSGVAGRFNLLSDGTKVATSANSTAIVDLDDGRVRMFLSEATELLVDAEDGVTLAGGQTWVSVEPSSGFFQIATDRGTIEVHGTSFGVVREGNAFKVYLASGSIHLRQGDRTTVLHPDEYVEIMGDGTPTVLSAADREPPAWTSRLYREYQITHSASFFPSSGVK